MGTGTRRLPFIFLIFLLSVSTLTAQIAYTQFYGKNRVMYTDFNWESYATEHFDIYYYTKDTEMLQTVAQLAESAYAQISDKIKHQLSAKVPLLYYKTTTDFQQSNLFRPPEGVLGVSEPLLFRVAIQGDMPVDDLYDLMLHELSHIFQFDLLWGSPGGVVYAVSQPPLWVFEGFSEYATERWSSWSELIVRDAVLNDRIPELNRAGMLFSLYPLIRDPAYDFGHAIYDYIENEFGRNGVRNFWQTMKNSPLVGRMNPVLQSFAMDNRQFTHEFKKHLREKYKDFVTRENPDNYGVVLGPEYPVNQYWFAFSHAVSPSGDMVAVVTYNVRDLDLDIMLFSVEDGRPIKNLTKGYSLKYEFIKFEIEPSNGKDVAWSHDGDTVAFFARAGHKHALFLVDVLSGNILKKIPLPQDVPSSPSFYPGGRELVFSAFEQGQRDIFKVDLETGESANLTQDELFEKAATLSPDGELMAYTIRLDAFDKLFVSPTGNLKKKTQLTFGSGNTITPEFSKDSGEIFFASDTRDAYNIYSIRLETGEIWRYTDVRTGCFLPVPDPREEGKVIFAAFNKGAFQLFKSKFEPELERTIQADELEPEEQLERFEPSVKIEIEDDKIAQYTGLGKLYIVGRPPVEAVVSTDGSIYGGSSVTFGDLFHDHMFNFTAYQVRSFRNYSLTYANMKNRFQWMAQAYAYTIFYYPSYAYYDPSLYNLLSYRDAMATREISGVSMMGSYPFSLYYRLEATVGYSYFNEDFYNPYINQISDPRVGGYNYFYNGNMVPFSLALVGETTRFKSYGPAKGNTFRLSLTQSLPISHTFLQNTSVSLDYRQYLYLGGDTLFAFRFNGFMSRGKNPYVNYWGGNNEVRSAYFYSIIGTEGWYANLEFRLPLVNAAFTLLGPFGPVRGIAFFDVTRSKLGDNPSLLYFPILTPEGQQDFILAEAQGSYGFGVEFFFLGMPMHVDFVKGLAWNSMKSPFDWTVITGWVTKFWIGFDF
ncbi:MAG: hypothetical protein WBB73_08080 [Candidatus Aminicenantaceae bacterium]